MKHSKIAIIGAGAVGSTIAYALMLKNSAAEIILIDIDTKRCSGEVRDLSDVLGLSRLSGIAQGTYEDAKAADIIIISAGRPQKPGQTRIELIEVNKKIFSAILDALKGLNPSAILMVVANPLDLLTYYAHKNFELPPKQIFGTGTFIDSHRLRHLLSCTTGIAEESIEAFVLGEHGDSEMIAWSMTKIAGMPVEHFGIDEKKKDEMARSVRNEAYEIIQAKGATYYGIGTIVATLVDMIIYNTREIVPLSWYHEKYEICMSIPVVLSEQGVSRVIPLHLTQAEEQLLARSAQTLKAYATSLKP